ncbi:proline-rich protein 36-like isoform X1 [Athene cunicularia]|uniref:proline-rich protein 36-like isoform X1 n=2 Tax=Athene cunicularia TaxID=194338 RepID=UPI000EF67CA9|nr:proline-rich protein 36-like isoform X1 [Athene cunicularia]
MTHLSLFCSCCHHVPSLSSLLFEPVSHPSFLLSFILNHIPFFLHVFSLPTMSHPSILLFHHPPNPTQPSFLCSSITHRPHSSFPCSITHHIPSLFLCTSIFHVPPLLLLLLCCPPIPSLRPMLLSPSVSHTSLPSSSITHQVPSFLSVLLHQPPCPIPSCAPLSPPPIPPCSPPLPSHPTPPSTLLLECAVIHCVPSLPAMPCSSITHHVLSCPLVLLHPYITSYPSVFFSFITHHLSLLLPVLLHCPSYPTFLSSCHTGIPSLSPAPPSSTTSHSSLPSSTSHHLLMSSFTSTLSHPSSSCFASSFSFPFIFLLMSTSQHAFSSSYQLPPSLASISYHLFIPDYPPLAPTITPNHFNLHFSSPHLSSPSSTSSYLLILFILFHFPIPKPTLTSHYCPVPPAVNITQSCLLLLHPHISSPPCASPFPISLSILFHCSPIFVFLCPLNVSSPLLSSSSTSHCLLIPPLLHLHLPLPPCSPPPAISSLLVLLPFALLHSPTPTVSHPSPCPNTAYLPVLPHPPLSTIFPVFLQPLFSSSSPFHYCPYLIAFLFPPSPIPSPSSSISYLFLHLSLSIVPVNLHLPLFPILFHALSPLALSILILDLWLSHHPLSFTSHSLLVSPRTPPPLPISPSVLILQVSHLPQISPLPLPDLQPSSLTSHLPLSLSILFHLPTLS